MSRGKEHEGRGQGCQSWIPVLLAACLTCFFPCALQTNSSPPTPPLPLVLLLFSFFCSRVTHPDALSLSFSVFFLIFSFFVALGVCCFVPVQRTSGCDIFPVESFLFFFRCGGACQWFPLSAFPRPGVLCTALHLAPPVCCSVVLLCAVPFLFSPLHIFSLPGNNVCMSQHRRALTTCLLVRRNSARPLLFLSLSLSSFACAFAL